MAEAKLVCLMSGGIDSPVAAYLMLKRGADVVLLHMDNRPFADDSSIMKVKLLAKKISEATGRKLKLYVAPHGESQSQIVANADRKLTCLLCRRMMYRTACAVAEKEGAEGIVTGESLGQVASQTLDNLAAERSAARLPVLRPLLGFDKEETIIIARKIGTYELSILPGECCNLAPIRPETHAKEDVVIRAEEKLDAERLAKESAGSAEITVFSP